MKTGHHSVYDCHYHLVLITRYRHPCITPGMRSDIADIFRSVLYGGATLDECNGEEDHLHFLLSVPPHVPLSRLINSLKTVSSRLIRKKYAAHLRPYYWKPLFWSRSYCLVTTGGAGLETVRRYIQSQAGAP
jgi:putative transposase